MDLTTSYLGLTLRSPLVASASPLTESVETIAALEAAGAGAVVLRSLFEEQISLERYALEHHLFHGSESFPEALSYFPEASSYSFGPDEYLKLIRSAKETVSIPVIASLNGTTPGGWTSFASEMEGAGADALELNLYDVAADIDRSGADVEASYVQVVEEVRAAVRIPLAVKLGPFFSSFANFARRLDDCGVNGLVLFNRFYQPDIDLVTLDVKSGVSLSHSDELRLPLRWIAILYGRVKASLAATSGVHTGLDAAKLLLAGADVTMLCAALLRGGVVRLTAIEQELLEWLDENEYRSLDQLRGSMSHRHTADPSAYERVQYMKDLQFGPWADQL
ncbi:MAG: dihydroorotate dehydrogenase-like protein [Planctomycetota bacterium]